MTVLARHGCRIALEPGGALHFGSDERLDVLSLVIQDGHVWQVDQSEFARLLRRQEWTAYEARARGADPLRQCHRFMCEQGGLLRRIARPVAPVTEALQAAYRAYLDGRTTGSPNLALWRHEGTDARPVLCGGHLKAAFRVAHPAQRDQRGHRGLRFTHAECVAGEPRLLAAVWGRLRLDTHTPMPTSRPTEWGVVLPPDAGLRFEAHLSPPLGGPPQPEEDLLDAAFAHCTRHYAPQLRATVDALRREPGLEPDASMARFIDWAGHALALAESDRHTTVIQLGAGAGPHAHPDSGEAGSGQRIAVALTADIDAGRARAVSQSIPMSWLLVRRLDTPPETIALPSLPFTRQGSPRP